MLEKLFRFNDGCLAALIATQNNKNKWELYGVSIINGMGNAEYEYKLFEFDFVDIVGLNGYDGLSYICLNKEGRWGLLELTENNSVSGIRRLISDFEHHDMESMLKKHGINRENYRQE